MQILIEKDSATRVPREVKDIDEAKAIGLQFPVYVVGDDNSQIPLAEYLGETEPVAEDPVVEPVAEVVEPVVVEPVIGQDDE